MKSNLLSHQIPELFILLERHKDLCIKVLTVDVFIVQRL